MECPGASRHYVRRGPREPARYWAHDYENHGGAETTRYVVFVAVECLGMWLIICFLEVRDGKKSYDPAPHSKEMLKLNQVRSLLLTACPRPTNFSRPLVESTAFHHW